MINISKTMPKRLKINVITLFQFLTTRLWLIVEGQAFNPVALPHNPLLFLSTFIGASRKIKNYSRFGVILRYS